MADEVFSLVYDGDAIEDGEMSAAELGPALIAISELFTTANDLFNGTETTVATNVKANFKEGSFEVLLHIHQALCHPTAILTPGVFVLGASSLITKVIGKAIDKVEDKLEDGVVEGLFKLFGVLKGRKPQKIEQDDSRKVSVFVLGNNNSITVSQDTAKLYEDPSTRTYAALVASPLRHDGIKNLRITRDNEEIVQLERRDFTQEAEVSTENTDDQGEAPQQLIVEISKPAFVEGKWSVSDGSKRFQVDMEDETFKSRVHAREVGFYDGDLYRVEMVTTQRLKNRRLTTERKITRVIGPVKGAVIQDSLTLPKSARRFLEDDEL